MLSNILIMKCYQPHTQVITVLPGIVPAQVANPTNPAKMVALPTIVVVTNNIRWQGCWHSHGQALLTYDWLLVVATNIMELHPILTSYQNVNNF